MDMQTYVKSTLPATSRAPDMPNDRARSVLPPHGVATQFPGRVSCSQLK